MIEVLAVVAVVAVVKAVLVVVSVVIVAVAVVVAAVVLAIVAPVAFPSIQAWIMNSTVELRLCLTKNNCKTPDISDHIYRDYP